jgi:ubiquinone/menaquinone biosynthesis C-methylase UbiE
VELNRAKQLLLDEVLTAYNDDLRREPADQTAAVTLGYTHSLHQLWRTVLSQLPVSPHSSVLDLGCGLGILSFELAANLPVRVHGIDIEPRFVFHAQQLLDRLDGRHLFAEGSLVSFSAGDLRALDVPDGSIDLLFVREVLQFLPDPQQAADEMLRVLKAGGYACVSDTDDQLYMTWPPSDAQSRLVEAVTALHRGRGGDRNTGRKLSSYLRRSGFEINSLLVLPEAQHRLVDSADPERALVLEQLRAGRDRIVGSGTMASELFDSNLAELETEPPHEEFRMNASIVVLGRKPL